MNCSPDLTTISEPSGYLTSDYGSCLRICWYCYAKIIWLLNKFVKIRENVLRELLSDPANSLFFEIFYSIEGSNFKKPYILYPLWKNKMWPQKQFDPIVYTLCPVPWIAWTVLNHPFNEWRPKQALKFVNE